MVRRLLPVALFSAMLGCDAGAAVQPVASAASTGAAQAPTGPAAAASAERGAPSNAPGSASSAASSGPGASAPGAASAPAGPVLKAAVVPAATALAKDPPKPPDGKGAGLLGPVDIALDGEWITRLATAEITEVTPNKGGGSVSLRMKFADGKKAAVKLSQTGHPTDPRAEIAGYHLDRLLGFGRTAAVVGRRFAFSELRAALVASNTDQAFFDRLDKLVVSADGQIDAAMVAWHTAALSEEETAPAWTATLDTPDAAAGDALSRLSEWSDLVVFDFLADNPDRYSGGNILRLGKGGPLVFLDQGAAFGKNRARDKLTTKDRLEKVCRFRKSTLAALRQLGPSGKEGSLGALLKKSVGRDPLAPVLDDAQIAAVDERAAALAAHTAACAKRLGAAASLAPAESGQ